MSKRNKGARARARKARLLTMRAELVLVMENRLEPHHLRYNHQRTAMLLEQFQWGWEVPQWAQKYLRMGRLRRSIADDHIDAFARAVNAAVITGTGIVRLTPDQQSGTIMDMDSGNASGHDT